MPWEVLDELAAEDDAQRSVAQREGRAEVSEADQTRCLQRKLRALSNEPETLRPRLALNSAARRGGSSACDRHNRDLDERRRPEPMR